MHYFHSNGVEIAFFDQGEGPPIVLLHGFASNWMTNWVATGWVATLRKAGRRVIGLDHRGHGNSQKLYDPAHYGAAVMAEDVRRLLDHLGIEQADVMGYSMGARIAAFLTLNHPDRIGRVIFAGLGINMVHGLGGAETIAHALEARSLLDVTDPMARAFRQFAEQTGSDLRALAACMRASREPIAAEALKGIEKPVLVVVGGEDHIAGSAEALAALMPNAQAVSIPRRDHMKTVGDKHFKQAVLDFIRQ